MPPAILTGLDILIRDDFALLQGRSVGLLCNQASLTSSLDHATDALHVAHCRGILRVVAIFGPQHGLWGHTQDNMIEWEGRHDGRLGWKVHSLYGAHREPSDAMLEGIDTFVIDLPDIGARCYSFLWTMALCLKACAARGIRAVVLDRPNPINGTSVEGPVLAPAFSSFIGLHPLPMRHGMTMGEMARHLQRTAFPALNVTVVPMEGWRRAMWWDGTGLPWAMPSPNMPAPDTATVYPGMALLEGTNASEARGTTRPFEAFGAPFLDAVSFARALNGLDLPGARFRPVEFEPTFDKHAGALCGGAFLHVLNREAFEPVLTGIAVLQAMRRMAPDAFAWKQPPFEYEAEKMPIDILAGNAWVREAVEEDWRLEEVRARLKAEASAFAPTREAALLYR